jgi:hypothetical protein
MRYDYDKEKKVLTLDGEGTLIISKNDYGMYLTESFIVNDDFKAEVKNHIVIGNYTKGIKTKFSQTLMALKYIWN